MADPMIEAEDQQSKCLVYKVYLPTIVLWARDLASRLHRGCQCGSFDPVLWGVSTRGLPAGAVVPSQRGSSPMASTARPKSMRTLFPGVRVGHCLRHALNKLPKKPVEPSPPRSARPCAPSSIPCCTGPAAQEHAGVCAWRGLRHFRRSRHHTRQGRPMASGYGAGFRTSCAVKAVWRNVVTPGGIQVPSESLGLSIIGQLDDVSSMALKGAVRRRQVFKTQCLAER